MALPAARVLGMVLAAAVLAGCAPPYTVKDYRDEVEGTVSNVLSPPSLGCNTAGTLDLGIDAESDRQGVRTYQWHVSFSDDSLINIEKGESLTLLVDGTKMVFSGQGSAGLRSDISFDKVTLWIEQAWYPVTVAQLREIANAREVKVKLEGERLFVDGCVSAEILAQYRRFLTEYPPSGEGGERPAPPKVAVLPVKHVGGIGVDLATLEGRVVTRSVTSPSPAQRAGLRAGDVFIACDNRPVGRASDLSTYIHARPGQDIAFSVLRAGATLAMVIRTANDEVPAGLDAEDRVGDMLADGQRVTVAVVIGTLQNPTVPAGQLAAWRTRLGPALKDEEERLLLARYGGDAQFALVDRQRLRDVTGELALQQTGAFTEATMARLGRLTGATHLLFVDSTRAARYESFIDTRVHRLIDVESGRTVAIGEMVLPE